MEFIRKVKDSNGVLWYQYRYWFSGKSEVIEIKHPTT